MLWKEQEQETTLKKEIEEMEGAEEAHLVFFGFKIPLVKKAVQRNIQRFQRPPIGPVGLHVKLRGEASSSPELARVEEMELNRPQVMAYLCHSDEARHQLAKILDKMYGQQGRNSKPKIFTSKFLDRRHVVHRPRVVPSGSHLLIDLLQIDEPNVYNHLVDQKSIESILVCTTQSQAKQLMTHKETVPDNVSYAITQDFYRFHPPKGSSTYRSYFMEPLQGAGMLKSTLSNLMAERGVELEGLETLIRDLKREQEEVVRSRRSYEAEKKRSVSAIQSLRGKVASVNSQLSQAKAEQENQADDLANLEARLASKLQDVDEADNRLQEIVLRRAQISKLISEKEEDYKRKKKDLTLLKSGTNPLQKQQREINTMISNKTKEILNQEKLVKKLAAELDSLKQEQKKQRDDERQFEAAARKITGTEIVPQRTVKQLNAKILQLQKKIKSKTENQDTAEFLNYFQDMKERYLEMKKQIENLETMLLKIEKMNNERLDNFQVIRNIISNNVRRRFNAMIATFAKQIGCQVFLRIDNKNKQLQFSFQTEDGEKDSGDLSRLSGGEKSYTQMCLICALWDMMEPPFRYLYRHSCVNAIFLVLLSSSLYFQMPGRVGRLPGRCQQENHF